MIIYEECIPTEVNYANLGMVEDRKTLVKAAGMWREDQKVTQQRILKLKTSWNRSSVYRSEFCPRKNLLWCIKHYPRTSLAWIFKKKMIQRSACLVGSNWRCAAFTGISQDFHRIPWGQWNPWKGGSPNSKYAQNPPNRGDMGAGALRWERAAEENWMSFKTAAREQGLQKSATVGCRGYAQSSGARARWSSLPGAIGFDALMQKRGQAELNCIFPQNFRKKYGLASERPHFQICQLSGKMLIHL